MPFCSPPKSLFGMTFQRKTSPRISGRTSVDIFSNEFGARLRWMMFPIPLSIYLSNASIESMLISGLMPVDPTMSGLAVCVETHSLTSNTVIVHNLKNLATRRCGHEMALASCSGLGRGGKIKGDR